MVSHSLSALRCASIAWIYPKLRGSSCVCGHRPGELGGLFFGYQLVPKPGKADELVQWLSNLKQRADSAAEPGTLQYNVVRFGDHVRVWEELVKNIFARYY